MLHVVSQPPGRSLCSHAPRSTPSPNGERFQCGVVVGFAPPRTPPQWAPRVCFVCYNKAMALTALRNARAWSCRRADDGPT